MSYGELTLPPVWTGINKQNGRFLKGHEPHNKGKKWNEIQPNRMSSQQIAWLIATAKCYDIDFNFECGQDWAFVRLY